MGPLADGVGDVPEGGPLRFGVPEGAAGFPLAHRLDGLLEDVLHVVAAAGADSAVVRGFRDHFQGRHVCGVICG